MEKISAEVGMVAQLTIWEGSLFFLLVKEGKAQPVIVNLAGCRVRFLPPAELMALAQMSGDYHGAAFLAGHEAEVFPGGVNVLGAGGRLLIDFGRLPRSIRLEVLP